MILPKRRVWQFYRYTLPSRQWCGWWLWFSRKEILPPWNCSQQGLWFFLVFPPFFRKEILLWYFLKFGTLSSTVPSSSIIIGKQGKHLMANMSKTWQLTPRQSWWTNNTWRKTCPFNLMMMELLDFCSMDQFPEFNIWLGAREARWVSWGQRQRFPY